MLKRKQLSVVWSVVGRDDDDGLGYGWIVDDLDSLTQSAKQKLVNIKVYLSIKNTKSVKVEMRKGESIKFSYLI